MSETYDPTQNVTSEYENKLAKARTTTMIELVRTIQNEILPSLDQADHPENPDETIYYVTEAQIISLLRSGFKTACNINDDFARHNGTRRLLNILHTVN